MMLPNPVTLPNLERGTMDLECGASSLYLARESMWRSLTRRASAMWRTGKTALGFCPGGTGTILIPPWMPCRMQKRARRLDQRRRRCRLGGLSDHAGADTSSRGRMDRLLMQRCQVDYTVYGALAACAMRASASGSRTLLRVI